MLPNCGRSTICNPWRTWCARSRPRAAAPAIQRLGWTRWRDGHCRACSGDPSKGIEEDGGPRGEPPWMRAETVEEQMFARDEDILRAAEDWRGGGRRGARAGGGGTMGAGGALATVVETWGSAPRPVGSNLVIDDQGNFLGSVSGGCVEGAVVTEALDVIESGKPKTLEFGVADETAWKVGLSCGGTIRVYVEKVE